MDAAAAARTSPWRRRDGSVERPARAPLRYLRLIYGPNNDLTQAERDAWSAPWKDDTDRMCSEDLAAHPSPQPGCHEADAHWIRNDTMDAIRNFAGPPRPPVAEFTDWPMSWPGAGFELPY